MLSTFALLKGSLPEPLITVAREVERCARSRARFLPREEARVARSPEFLCDAASEAILVFLARFDPSRGSSRAFARLCAKKGIDAAARLHRAASVVGLDDSLPARAGADAVKPPSCAGLNPTESIVVRLRLVWNEPWPKIAVSIGVSRSRAQDIFKAGISRLRAASRGVMRP